MPTGVVDLVRSMVVGEPTRPRLTWYGPDGERIELSGRVLDNWVAKSANLLVEEFDAGPGTCIGTDLPVHWRAATWMLAAWCTGACVVVVPPGQALPAAAEAPGLTAWITARPDGAAALAAAGRGATVVAVALPGLARDFGPGLPAGALDAAAEIRVRADLFIPPVLPVAGDPALLLPGREGLAHGDLLPSAEAAADRLGLRGGVRLLTGAGPDRAVEGLLAAWYRDGSVVLHHDLDRLTGPELDRLTETERITATLRRDA